MSVLVGTNLYEAPGDAARRVGKAVDALRALRGVGLANLQWPDAPHHVEGLRTVPALRRDSRDALGGAGRRRPFLPELLDGLADAAEEEGREWFLFLNADVEVQQALVDRIASERLQTYAVARTDYDGETGEDRGVLLSGTDAFAARVDWWRKHRTRFRDYALGDWVWDNVYTAVFLSHSDGAILNRGVWLRHEAHPPGPLPGTGPSAEYVRWLAAQDRPYFSLWAAYHGELVGLRAAGAGAEEEDALRRRVFRHRPGVAGRVVQALRVLRARRRWNEARRRTGGGA